MHLWGSTVRVHDTQACRKIEITSVHMSLIFDVWEIFCFAIWFLTLSALLLTVQFWTKFLVLIFHLRQLYKVIWNCFYAFHLAISFAFSVAVDYDPSNHHQFTLKARISLTFSTSAPIIPPPSRFFKLHPVYAQIWYR